MKPLLLPERPDVLLAGIAPKHVRKWLRDVGGITPWGENRYRLVLAECVMLYIGGRWHDWLPNTDLSDQGGLDFSGRKKTKYVTRDPADRSKQIVVEAEVPAVVGVKQNKPIRVIEEMRWIPRYTDIKGWLFQSWFPATYYSQEHYEITVKGRPDLPLLGEFPSRGQYERQFFYFDKGLDGAVKPFETFPTIPGESWMERAIEHNERQIAQRAGNTDPNSTEVKWRTLKAINELAKAREAYEKRQRSEFEAKIKEETAFLYSNSLLAGKMREEIAAKCRMKGIVLGHVGN